MSNVVETHVCQVCKTPKNRNFFSPSEWKKGGASGRCRSCLKGVNRAEAEISRLAGKGNLPSWREQGFVI